MENTALLDAIAGGLALAIVIGGLFVIRYWLFVICIISQTTNNQ